MRKLLSTIFSALLVLTCISPVSAGENNPEVSPTPETEEVLEETASDNPSPSEIEISEPSVETTETEISMQSAETDLCNISAFKIGEKRDGSVPFDRNNDQGNDLGPYNHIVRTFDSITYTLKYTTALKSSATQGVDSGNVMIDFNLPCDPRVARFNKDSMQWCLDMIITYTYSDGTASTSWDKSKTVTNQRVTGRRFLQNTSSQNVIPGTGTLSVSIDVKMAKNGERIQPSFTVWMEGNAETEKRNIGDYVDVTAAPKYDIYIGRNTSTDILGWYNTRLGTVTTDQKNVDDVYGRLEGYPVAVRVVNDSPEKGLKGIELPSGNISFSIKMSSTVNGRDVTYDPAYKPFLWDYKMNTRDYGALGYGRTLTPLGQLYAAWDDWQSEVPYNAGGGEFSCYNGGRMVVNPDENDSTLLHVVLTGYEFDVENFTFPERDFGHPQPFFPANVGFFSVGYLTSVCRFPRNVQNIENILFGLNVRNFLATSLSGTLVGTETTTSNNTRNITVTTYPKGTHTKRNFFYDENRNQIAQPWDAANSYAYAGGNVTLCNGVSYGGDL